MGSTGQVGQLRPDGTGRAERLKRPEPRIRSRRTRTATHRRFGHHHPYLYQRAALYRQPIRGNRAPCRCRWLAHPAARRGTHLARSPVLQHGKRYQRRECCRTRHLHATGSKCHGSGREREKGHGRNQQELSGRTGI